MSRQESIISRDFDGITNYMFTTFNVTDARSDSWSGFTSHHWTEDFSKAGRWISNHAARTAIINNVPERNQERCSVNEVPA
jgi:hypothetical protein